MSNTLEMGSEWALNSKFSFFQPLFAFEYKEVFPENGWKVYDPTWEYRRQVGIVPCASSSSLLFRSEAGQEYDYRSHGVENSPADKCHADWDRTLFSTWQ